MKLEYKAGTALKVTISSTIKRAAARTTLERIFLTDKAVVAPIAAREANFKAKPKRRGGRIWTKRPNKVHPTLAKGETATVKATPQLLRDLGSVEDFVQVETA